MCCPLSCFPQASGGAGGKPQVVIVGSSFIGMEAAAYLIKLKTVDVTVIGMESVRCQLASDAFVGFVAMRFAIAWF